LEDIRELIENARQSVAAAVNTGLSILYRQVGERIRKDILNGRRAVYGRPILPTLSAQLVPQFGSGFSARNLSSEQIELLQLDKSGIKVAEYLTQLPDRELLKQKLHKAVMMAREQMRKKMIKE
jgi:hypothetical protein